jgi:hypothetical protein
MADRTALDPMRTDIERRIRKTLRSIEGVLESPGMFMHDDAYWVNGKEIAHFHDDDLELRLTRAVISANRERLRADPRIERRAPSSDWVNIRCASPRDVELVAELAELAAHAHRPPAGMPTAPPPIGPQLERMRRFH